MWRRSYSNEDWERRKTYLLRSYFEDNISTLTPIEEADEDSSIAPFPRPIDRPLQLSRESLLPELIIEKVTKVNHHDEPDEFYDKLQVVVQNYVDDLKRYGSSEPNITDLSDASVNHDHTNIRRSLLENSSESNQSDEARKVHEEASSEEHQDLDYADESISVEDCGVLSFDDKMDSTNENSEPAMERVDKAISEQSADSSTDRDWCSQEEEIEVMRANDENSSCGSFVFFYSKKLQENVSKFEDLPQSSEEENVADKAFVIENESGISTPESESEKVSTFYQSESEKVSTFYQSESPRSSPSRTSIRSLDYSQISSPSRPKQRKVVADVSVQTDDMQHVIVDVWDEVKSNLFIGAPIIYKLCRCSNHSCS